MKVNQRNNTERIDVRIVKFAVGGVQSSDLSTYSSKRLNIRIYKYSSYRIGDGWIDKNNKMEFIILKQIRKYSNFQMKEKKQQQLLTSMGSFMDF